MSIASEIQRLYGVRGDILQAIADKGVTVPSGSKLDDCPELISSITGGGGSGVYIPDVAISESAMFKKFFPIKEYGREEKISSDLVYDGSAWLYNNPLIINTDFSAKTTDEFEIAVTFKKTSYSTSGRCLIGCVNGYFYNFTIEYDGNGFFVGIPSTGYDWSAQIILPTTLQNSEWYTVLLVQSNKIITLTVKDKDGNVVSSTTKTGYNLIDESNFRQLELGGCNASNIIHWNGLIDLKKTCIKKNGAVLWGANSL